MASNKYQCRCNSSHEYTHVLKETLITEISNASVFFRTTDLFNSWIYCILRVLHNLNLIYQQSNTHRSSSIYLILLSLMLYLYPMNVRFVCIFISIVCIRLRGYVIKSDWWSIFSCYFSPCNNKLQ